MSLALSALRPHELAYPSAQGSHGLADSALGSRARSPCLRLERQMRCILDRTWSAISQVINQAFCYVKELFTTLPNGRNPTCRSKSCHCPIKVTLRSLCLILSLTSSTFA